MLHKRPTTPGRSSPQKENNLVVPEIPNSRKEDKEKEKKEKRSSLAFLRRSKSGDTVRGTQLRPIVPNIPQQPPKIPDLWNGISPPQPLRSFGGSNADNTDSEDIVAGLGIPGMSPGRRSTDTGISGASSAPGGYYIPVKSSGKDSVATTADDPLIAVASMANRGRYGFASAGSTVNSPRRVRRRKDPTPFK